MSPQRLDFLGLVPTEQINPNTHEIDLLSTEAMLACINAEDQSVPKAVQAAIPQIAQVVDRIVAAFEQGGRLYYVGAGTSGRLGVLDASECPPTFGVDPNLVNGLIAGGDVALRQAVEGAEDVASAGEAVIRNNAVTDHDVVVGLSASGGATYVVAAVQTAKQLGAFTAAITCHAQGPLAQAVDIPIVVEVGPEVIAGSTRMKAGTAQKLVLNMLTTGAMIGWGKTYRNLMVDLRPTNAKLKDRAIRLVSLLARTSPEDAEKTLKTAQGQVKLAVVMRVLGLSFSEAQAQLAAHHGKLRAVLAGRYTSD